MDADPALIVVDIQKDLCRLPDPGHGLEGMAPPEDGEIGHRIEFKKVRTSNDKEIANHQVRGPGQKEIGEGIEDIEHIPAFLADDIVHLGGKGFKSRIRIEFIYGHPAGIEQGGMAGETHIDDPLVVPQRLLHEGEDKAAVIFDVVHLENDIVAAPEIIEDLVQTLNARTDTGKRDHGRPPERIWYDICFKIHTRKDRGRPLLFLTKLYKR